jgi:hypothetical protein
VNNYRDKVYAVRAFDLLLLLAAVVILAFLARAVFGRRWRVPYCFALSTLLWPGVIVRAITVSNSALELPLVLLYVFVVWTATAKPRARSLVAAAGVLGLCVLTQLTLVCLAALLVFPLVGYLRGIRGRFAFGAAVLTLTLALPLAMVAPWLASNESRYGALTASSLEERLTGAYGPAGPRSGVGAVASGLGRLTRVALPQEWWSQRKGFLGVISFALPVLLLVAALPAIWRLSLLRTQAAGLLASPLLLGIATLIGIVLLAAWPAALFPRYLNPMVAPFALFAGFAWRQTPMREGPLLGLAALSCSVAGLIWFYMAGVYYFPNVGATLGIHGA